MSTCLPTCFQEYVVGDNNVLTSEELMDFVLFANCDL